MARAAVARRVESVELSLDAYLRANAAPAGIDLGSCVLVSRLGGRSRGDRTEEGVVIELVQPGGGVLSARVVDLHTDKRSGSTVTRYVVQCWTRRVLRRAAEMELVCR